MWKEHGHYQKPKQKIYSLNKNTNQLTQQSAISFVGHQMH